MTQATNAIIEQIEKLAARSIRGEIDWKQPNPSTFRWVSSGSDATAVTIQKAELPIGLRRAKAGLMEFLEGPTETFNFQIAQKGEAKPLVSLSSLERAEFYPILKKLFESAETGQDRRTAEVLKRLFD